MAGIWVAFTLKRRPVPTLDEVGHAKRQMEQEHDQGWSFTDGWVCRGCVADAALETILQRAEVPGQSCDFCGANVATDLDVLLAAFVAGLRNEYEDALEGVSWDGREGGFQWSPTWDSWELVGDFGHVLTGDGLVEAVSEAMVDVTWVERDFATRRRDEVLVDTWDEFSNAVKYETRYVLWLRDDQSKNLGAGEVSPALILSHVGDLIDKLDLVQLLPAGHRLWRAQPHQTPSIDATASRLGTAPRELAKQANRMSPAGIPMFYGAEDQRTAIREVAVGSDDPFVTWGQFELSRPTAVVDLTRLPAIPSMFDPEWGSLRRQLIFVHEFVRQLSDRARPEFEQIDYVPTQILTEYLLHVYRNGDTISGLLYPSSITGDPCAVINVSNDNCVDTALHQDLQAVLDPGTVDSARLEPASS